MDLQELISAALERGVGISNMNAETVLGLSRNEVQAIRDASPERPVVGNASITNWQANNWKHYIGDSSVFVRQDSTGRDNIRREVAGEINAIAKNKNVFLFVEENSTVRAIDDAWKRLRLPLEEELTTTANIGGIEVLSRRATGETIDIDGVPVAKQNGNIIHLLVYPWHNLKTKKLTTVDMARQTAVFKAIVDAVVPSQESPDEEMKNIILSLDLLPAFARSIQESSARIKREKETELARNKATISELQGDIFVAASEIASTKSLLDSFSKAEQTEIVVRAQREISRKAESSQALMTRRRTELVRNITIKAELEQALAGAERDASVLQKEAIAKSLLEITRIRSIGPVRDVKLVGGRTPAIEVTLHPVVMEYRSSKYLIDGLVFKMNMTGNLNIKWKHFDQNRGGSPHPHVSTYGETCWGDAQTPLQQAIQRKEYSTAVRFITGWARVYNQHSPYQDITNFTTTQLSTGWHPELPVSL